ncbi:unnamed protein product [Mesocestoides corti]|uniref:Uncharacterized protein n=1 Tax=Mesocestoides corti TaxID=53468 RepID=A0A0R3UBE9_MESCO|nr:unnamed protein product [Mesocestoides corti]
MRSLTNLSLSLLLLLLLFTHTRMAAGSDEVDSQRLESGQVEEVDVEPVDAANSMLGSGESEIDDDLHPARWRPPRRPRPGRPRFWRPRPGRPFFPRPPYKPI